jgi:large subunit ribosomal protein L6
MSTFSIKSNIGKQPIVLQNSKILLDVENSFFYIKGKLGMFRVVASDLFFLEVTNREQMLTVIPKKTMSPFASALWGTYRSLLSNVVTGVNLGFVQNLELVGLGYKASVQDSLLNLRIGKSHDVFYALPKHVTVKFFTNTLLSLRGIDLQKVRHTAFQIYKLKKPDVYRNKGIRIPNMVLLKKEGKKQK